jgi:hypothetical protein
MVFGGSGSHRFGAEDEAAARLVLQDHRLPQPLG